MGRYLAWLPLIICLLALPCRADNLADRDMVIESIDGDVTTNEYQSFIDKLSYLPPPPTSNIGNLMADEKDGARQHGLQTFYAFTHDRRVLDKAVEWSDAFLHARNDPVNGRVIWTGKRDLCWPNKATKDVQALHSSAENGDVIEHIVNTARLILENPAVWNETAPPDKFSFGATYLDRAKTYVRECQRSADTTIVPWFVRSTKDGYRLYHPDSPAYLKCCGDSGPVPWNQQQCIVGALLRLAQCHRLLNDVNSNIAYFEKITADTAHWFFATALPVSAHNRVCYLWPYVAPRDPAEWPEVITEADYDMFIFRAYQADLGPSRLQMQRLINTARFLMYLGTNRFAGKVNGTSTQERHDRKFLNFEWIEMSVLDHDFYRMVASAVLTSHEYYDNLAVEGAVLSAKHYWANAPAGADDQVADPATNIPHFVAQQPSLWNMPTPAILGMILLVSELLLTLTRRSSSNASSKDRHSLRIIWLVVAVAVTAGVVSSYRLPAFRLPHRELIVPIACSIFAGGMAIRWYSIIHLGRFFTVNVALAGDHHLVDTGPYRLIRHPSYAGSLLCLLALALSLVNWASFLLLFVPCCGVMLWRMAVEERALADGLGEPYRQYMTRTRRLIPFVY